VWTRVLKGEGVVRRQLDQSVLIVEKAVHYNVCSRLKFCVRCDLAALRRRKGYDPTDDIMGLRTLGSKPFRSLMNYVNGHGAS